MQIKEVDNGIFFKLDPLELKYGAWQEFLKKIKKFKFWVFNPVEMPDGENWWWIGLQHKDEFFSLKTTFIDDPVKTELSLKKLGYSPTPKGGGHFRCRFGAADNGKR